MNILRLHPELKFLIITKNPANKKSNYLIKDLYSNLNRLSERNQKNSEERKTNQWSRGTFDHNIYKSF